jgi:hypothetical protein
MSSVTGPEGGQEEIRMISVAQRSVFRLAKFISCAALIGVSICTAGCIGNAQPEDSQPAESVGATNQALSAEYWFSWGGTMNSAGTAFTNGSAFSLNLGLSGSSFACMITGVAGDLSGDTHGVKLMKSGPSGTWVLAVRPAPGHSANAAASCFPATFNSEPTLIEQSDGLFPLLPYDGNPSQEVCGFWDIFAANSTSSIRTTTDHGSNPNVFPLTGGTWNISQTSAPGNGECASAPFTSAFNWVNNGGTLVETMPLGTSCFLTSFKGTLTTNDFVTGAWASVNFATGVWTFTVSPGHSAWWLCVD